MKIKKTQSTLCLKPTQFSVGMLEIEHKVLKFKKMKRKKLAKCIRSKPIPVVVSPWLELCVIDHHHFLFACWHAGIRKVRIKIEKDFSKKRMSYVKFWKMMTHEHLAYPYDQFGDGPRSALYLPIDVRGMADDPYRSLAWMVRKEGGYENSKETFAEFQWADLFRKHALLENQGRSGFQKAIRGALKLARSPEAKHLPGFLNPAKMKKEIDEVTANVLH